MAGKRNFELVDGTSNKFWEIWIEGTQVLTRYGKIGSQGQTTAKDEGSDENARKLFDRLVREKTGKGYVESPTSAAAGVAAAPKVHLLEWYTPEPFPAPFPSAFDPRADLYEVIDAEGEGSVKVASSKGQFLTVAPSNVATGIDRNPGARVSGFLRSAPEPRLLGKLFGSKSSVAPALHLEPLSPSDEELRFAESWLGSLRQAGLSIEALSLPEVLKNRLRVAAFGARPVRPLRRDLRLVLEMLVGRFPATDEGGGNLLGQAAALLGKLGVNHFEPPSPAKNVKHAWHVAAHLADHANLALKQSDSPLRFIACEREVFPPEQTGGERDYRAEYPVWLVLSPASVPALESAAVLRRYRGTSFPLASAKADPRVLRLIESEATPNASVVSMHGERVQTAAPVSAPSASGFEIDPKNLGAPKKTPCQAFIRSFVAVDGVGELVTDDGVLVRFGTSACKGFQPTQGLHVWLIGAAPHPSGKGFRAQVVNLTGEKEGDQIADFEAARQKAEAAGKRESALLRTFRMKKTDWHYFDQLVGLPPQKLCELAAALVSLRKESHVFERLFEDLATVAPESFHAQLGEIDWRTEPESLAWVGAPFDAVQFAVKILDKGAAIQLIEQVPVGTIGPAHEMARRQRSPANDIGAAVLVLMRSGHPKAIAAVEKWIAKEKVAPSEANALLVVAGWLYIDSKLHRLWGQRTAHRLPRGKTGELSVNGGEDPQRFDGRVDLLVVVVAVEVGSGEEPHSLWILWRTGTSSWKRSTWAS